MSPLVGSDTINQQDFSLVSLVVSFLGAIVLLAMVKLIQRSRAHA
ncbi:MAG: GlsB/YeaQ/YmgE family stress response membrane protein [Burkholderiales bacterium]